MALYLTAKNNYKIVLLNVDRIAYNA